MSEIRVIGLRVDDGKVSPLAWTDAAISKKELRRITRKFKKDEDVVEPVLLDWVRLYQSLPEMKAALPKYAR